MLFAIDKKGSRETPDVMARVTGVNTSLNRRRQPQALTLLDLSVILTT